MNKRSQMASVAAAVLIVGIIALVVFEGRELAKTPPGPSSAVSTDDPIPAVEFRASLAVVPDRAGRVVHSSVYVPAYGSIRAMSGRSRIGLATTLSVHNTSSEAILVMDRIDYFGTDGSKVRSFLDEPIAIKPLGTIEFFVSAGDSNAASGANFLVDWWASERISEPIIEAVMIGTVGTTSYSFVSRGQTLRALP